MSTLRVSIVAAGSLVVCASLVLAAPPLNPLPSPLYSFDLISPAVADSFVEADDVLALNLPYPVPAISAFVLGLGAEGDDLDALSGANKLILLQTSFALRFSVSRESTGDVAPDAALAAAGYPYNVLDQSARGHQAGDEYISLRLFSFSGASARVSSIDNHTMVKNNYDEGGSDYAARPETHARTMTGGGPQDNVDAITSIDASAVVYYSVTAATPSLSTLPGSATPSGAHIFRQTGGVITMFASFAQLGLEQADDIDGIVVFDFNIDGVFNNTDRVLFSLTPASPSLATIPGASAVGAAADVFMARPGQGPVLFTSAASLGLIGESDDIDALEILICPDATVCATSHGVRNVPGDFDDDGDVGPEDREAFEDCYRGEGQSYDPGCEPGDFDSDDDIDCDDGVRFVQAWTVPQPPQVPANCRTSIPAASVWGVVGLACAMMIAGTLIGRSRRLNEKTSFLDG